ncbi:MAG: transglycosylase domain-containing protein, partial [Streptosporangiaceae bacterium]
MSSRADDFDASHRDRGNGRPRGYGAPGGATIDYDLGYAEDGFDTQGFRSPEAPAGPVGPVAPAGAQDFRGGEGARGTQGFRGQEDTGGLGQLTREPDTLRPSEPLLPDGPYRNLPLLPDRPRRSRSRSRSRHGPSGPGTGGSNGTGGPGGPGGPRGKVKVKGSWWRHWTLRKAIGLLAVIIGAFIVMGAIVIAVAYEETPVPTEAMEATSYAQTVVLSSDGTLIGRFGTTDRQMMTLSQVPQNLIDAVLAVEDRNFYNEGGISLEGITRASYEDLTGGDGSVQGGSTITQEFVRNYYVGIGTQQTLSRKFKEILVSLKVGKEKSKQWILDNYLNTIFLGDGAYGVGAAAQTYFDIPPQDLKAKLTTAQAAVIAAVIQQPSTYPLQQYRPQLVARWHVVLNDMVQMGDLTAQQAAAMKFPTMGDHVPQSFGKDVWDPYIMDMVKNELIDDYHFSQSDIDDGGYTIRTSINDAQMRQLYDAVIQNESTINSSADPQDRLQYYMHVGAVLENPANGEIEALYPGPGFPGYKYNNVGPTITAKECKKIDCEVNMAVYNREQVGSSFKPYILALAVKQGMNVQTSTLDGYDNLCIPLDSSPTAYPAPAKFTAAGELYCQTSGSYPLANDDTGENGQYTPQMAMAESINTAYADLWHVVAGSNGQNIIDFANSLGLDTIDSGLQSMRNQSGVALGQASLTVTEQATMLATIDDYGVYHDAHVITSITRNDVQTPIDITTRLVFNANPQLNADEATEVQYAMSEDTSSYGTAPVAAMSNGQEMIAKTGTTNTAQSAFFLGAIPKQTLAVAIFTNEQGKGTQSLNNLGGVYEGGYGGTWPATIWHTYAENVFVPMGVEQFNPPVFTGATWNELPPNLRHAAKP